MSVHPILPAALLAAPRPPPQAGAAAVRACLLAVLEIAILALLARLLGRRRSIAPAWDVLAHIPTPSPAPRAPLATLRAPSVHDGTHLVMESPILYVIGPRPNTGLRPLPRARPLVLARIARAPPH